ncbi:MAG: hypothetical protein IRZ17_14915 [Mycolicibacterium hassiacum]|jgi:hypothetical protein|uniref:hypothetical protein n=1 Tax=Mycolicibacterium hassiacum TaxID=46351 RepID=UPI0023F62566|nr:hypothetical protein [Mycolicibacterium hassiacum]MBX5487885.1 hypothetical protein [Mycolicibacterium hassiacum]
MPGAHDDHLRPDSKWSTYESNVQAYRQLSVATQSLFLATGAILLGSGAELAFFVTFLMAQVAAWYVFYPVIFSRCAIVDYHKFNLGSRFNREGRQVETVSAEEALREHEYASFLAGRRLRKKVYLQLAPVHGRPFRTLRMTRKKLDLVLPAMFTFAWLFFVIDILLRLKAMM